MAELIGYGPLKMQLSEQIKKAKEGSGDVVVGHAMHYATLVHETHKHQSKFLENAFRQVVNSGQAREMIRDGYSRHGNLQRALVSVAKLIKEISQENTPVKTGAK